MASSINASTTAGVVTTADTSGVLALQTNGTTAVTVDASQNVGIGTATPDIFSRGYGRIVGINDSGSSGAALEINSASSYPAVELGRGGVRKAFFTAQSTATELGNLEAVPLLFYTNSAERARFNTTGALVLAGGTTTANGIGITFPATQSASSDANTLDDYEEGTFTPTFTSLGTVTLAYGKYTKIGRIVCFYVSFSCTSTPTANSSRFTLPFLPSTFSLGTWTQSTTAGGFIEPQTGSAIAYFATSAASSTGQFYAAVVYET